MIVNHNKINPIDSDNFSWKKRPSEIRGFQRTYYLTSRDRDYIRIDYNLREKRVRLYTEIDSEGGCPYYSVINKGKITAERSVLSGRAFGCAEKFRERSELFSSVPNKSVLKLINQNYGISLSESLLDKNEERKNDLELTRQRYFKTQKNPYKNSGNDDSFTGSIGFIDFIDLFAGLILSVGGFYFFQYSYLAMGVVSAFFGLAVGLVDMFIRERSPVFMKMIFFILSGTAFYIYGYFF